MKQQDADRRCKLSREARESVKPKECKSLQLFFQPSLLPIVRTCDNYFVRIRMHVVDLMPSRPAVPAYGIHIREGFAARRAPECIGMLRALVGLEAAVRMSHPSAKRALQTNAPSFGRNRHYKRHSTSPGVQQCSASKKTFAPENYEDIVDDGDSKYDNSYDGRSNI